MNYRHTYHAGNFADVVKHIALVAVLAHLRKKEKPFVVIDTHAGRGLYDLESEAAAKTGEAESGIGRLSALAGAPPPLGAYLALARAFGQRRYPGSPLIAAAMLRARDRLLAIEKHEEEAGLLARALAPYPRARVVHGDGYERLIALLPPAERRGVVLIDPPYEAPDEFRRLADVFAKAHRRFATAIYLLWFPIKSPGAADAFCAEALAGGAAKAMRIDIDLGAGKAGHPERLSAAGLLVVNPPFGLDGDMTAALGVVAPLLGQGAKPCETRVEWLAGGP